MEDLIKYKLETQAEHISRLRIHAHDVNNSLNNLTHTIEIINNSIKNVFDKALNLSERIKVLEDDKTKRSAYMSVAKNIGNFWPLILIIIIILSALDLNKVHNLISIIK